VQYHPCAWLGKATTELGSHRSVFENFDILKFQKMKFKIFTKGNRFDFRFFFGLFFFFYHRYSLLLFPALGGFQDEDRKGKKTK
jgi:hypothetical protein